jgi:hypothetical protein
MTMKHDDDQSNGWAAFLSALPPSWFSVATAFNSASGVVEGEHEPDGTWTVDLLFGLSDVRRLLQAAPARFTSVAVGQDCWLDQHLEQEGGVLVAASARAVFSWNDNFASGLNATLSVYASDDRYQAAVEEAHAAHAEVFDGDQDEAA